MAPEWFIITALAIALFFSVCLHIIGCIFFLKRREIENGENEERVFIPGYRGPHGEIVLCVKNPNEYGSV